MKKHRIHIEDILKQTPSCLKIIDSEGKLLDMNDKGLSLIEADNFDSVHLADVYSLVHPDDRERFIDFNEKVCQGETGHLIFKIIGLKGTHRLMETYASPIPLEDGSIGHVAITNDVTALKRAQKVNEVISELRNSYFHYSKNPNEFFNFLLTNLLEITESEYGFIGEINEDQEGRFLRTYAITDISWSDETRSYYQKYKKEGLVFRNLKSLFGEVMTSEELLIANEPHSHPKAGGLPPGHPDLNAFLGVPFHSGNRFIAMCGLANCPGGYQKEVIDQLKPLFGAISEIVSHYQLEQVNVKKEKLLAETTERLELALEGSKLGIWDWNLTDNSVEFDQRWGEMLGIPYADLEMNLETWKTRVHPDDLDDCYKDINNYLEGKTERYINIHRMKHADGHWVYILDQGKISEYDSTGKPIRFTGTHLDITVQKQQEALLTAAKNEAVLAERSKSQFLATMSHEIRTPLNGVLGMVELLKDTPLNDEQMEMISSIETSGDALMTLLNDILDLSKMDSGKMVLEEKDFSIRTLLKDVTDLLNPKAIEKKLPLSYSLSSEEDIFVRGDIIRFKQILLNLISNAIKFTEKGKVNVKASYLPSQELELIVEDTGIGISKDAQDKLFEDFTQADSSTTRKFGGTGLGLSICKKLVELMKGQISLTSEIGLGTTFTIKVPIKSIDKISLKEKSPVKSSFAEQIQILVVEDNQTNQIIICRLLEKLGQKVITANNGQEAYELYCKRHKEIDLIFMDMHMPILDGLECTRLIRNESFGKRVPIIAFTANAFDSDKLECLDAGMNDFITKPIQRRKLIELLSQYID